MGILAAIVIIVLAAAAAAAGYFFLVGRKDLSTQAMELAEGGMFTDARGLIRGRLDREPNDPRLHFTMARIYNMEGDESNELHHMLQLHRIGRSVPELPMGVLINRIAAVYYKNERYSECTQFYLEALKLVPQNEEALARLAFLCAGQERFEHAERFFGRLIQMKPDVFEYRIGRGIVLSQLRKKDALAEFEAACALDPDNLSASLFLGLDAFLTGQTQKALERLQAALRLRPEPEVEYLINKALAAACYQLNDANAALKHAERCLQIALEETWEREEYDARLSVACMAIMAGDVEAANENLLTLEMRNMTDQKVISLSDYRMNVEEGLIPAGEVSPSGFNFRSFLTDWVRGRVPGSILYQISGLRMDRTFDIDSLLSPEAQARPAARQQTIDPETYIQRFNDLKGQPFETICRKIIAELGYRVLAILPYRDSDGMDFIAQHSDEKNRRAVFEFRKWKNQPISDIFLRNMQTRVNEQKAQEGFVIAAARLTDGAQAALATMERIRVINEFDLADLLSRVLE